MASLFFVAAALSFSVAAAAWWLQSTVFDPERSEEIADAVLEDDQIRRQIAIVIADHAAERLDVPPLELRRKVEQVALTPGGGEILSSVITQSHARVIGIRDRPVRIGPKALVAATRDERAAVLPPVTLPVEKVTAISLVRQASDWIIPIGAAAGGVLLLVGLVTHPARADALFGIGSLLIFVALMLVLIAYVVPVALVPALSDSTWTAAVPIIAKHNANTVFFGAGALLLGGLAVMAGSAAIGRRRAWRTPVTTSRYDQRHWS